MGAQNQQLKSFAPFSLPLTQAPNVNNRDKSVHQRDRPRLHEDAVDSKYRRA